MTRPIPAPRTARWRKRLADLLLLPPAIVVVLVNDLAWTGAKALLRLLGRIAGLERLRARMARLPVWLALTLFLIPEVASHLGTVAAAVALVERGPIAAVVVYVVTKATATLIAVWIYQACEPALLTVRWFARLHAWLSALRDRVMARLQPLLRVVRRAATVGRSRLTRRFRALRRWLVARVPGMRHRACRPPE